jgi:hypothetical protein
MRGGIMGKILAFFVLAFIIIAIVAGLVGGAIQDKAEKKVCAEHGMEVLRSETTTIVHCINYNTQETGYYKWNKK